MNVNREAIRRSLAPFVSELRQGERIHQYARDVAGCDCQSHTFLNIPCTVVGTTAGLGSKSRAGHGTDRCLLCGTTWVHRVRRTDPLVYVARRAA